eukprot:TRINITY_DN2595_c0_g1_i1.p1 TRINITY_DN2595_c0_g1~~TRINITY_DN2595_c0_g1_i1.p1  ORF type:complete len:474 (-),score=112.76 TRINITY_DN2595_c0_g1_i1:1041-2462(-)
MEALKAAIADRQFDKIGSAFEQIAKKDETNVSVAIEILTPIVDQITNDVDIAAMAAAFAVAARNDDHRSALSTVVAYCVSKLLVTSNPKTITELLRFIANACYRHDGNRAIALEAKLTPCLLKLIQAGDDNLKPVAVRVLGNFCSDNQHVQQDVVDNGGLDVLLHEFSHLNVADGTGNMALFQTVVNMADLLQARQAFAASEVLLNALVGLIETSLRSDEDADEVQDARECADTAIEVLSKLAEDDANLPRFRGIAPRLLLAAQTWMAGYPPGKPKSHHHEHDHDGCCDNEGDDDEDYEDIKDGSEGSGAADDSDEGDDDDGDKETVEVIGAGVLHVLAMCCMDDEMMNQLSAQSIIPVFISALHYPAVDVQYAAVMGLGNVARSDATSAAVAQSPSLLSLVVTTVTVPKPDVRVLHQSLALLRNLAFNKQNIAVLCADEQVMQLLVKQLSSYDAQLAGLAAATVRLLTQGIV